MYDGKTINDKNGSISEFAFSKTDYNITKFSSKSTMHQKTQENSTAELIKCLLILKDIKNNKAKKEIKKINNCKFENLENIYEELYSRIIKPLYVTFLITISLLFIMKSKDDHSFKSYKLKIYSFGFVFIIFLETSSKFISINILHNSIISFLPLLFVFLIYIHFLKKLRVSNL